VLHYEGNSQKIVDYKGIWELITLKGGLGRRHDPMKGVENYCLPFAIEIYAKYSKTEKNS
jgi:hypothetical protein